MKNNNSTRIRHLEKLIGKANKQLAILPKGKLEWIRRDSWRMISPTDTRALTGANNPLLQQLQQRYYLEHFIKVAEEEIAARESYDKKFPKVTVEELFDSLPERRQKFIKPLVVSPKQACEAWLNMKPFAVNSIPIPTDHPTCLKRVPYVRSKSEKDIVLALESKGLYYKYEAPVALVDETGCKTVRFPDFTILNENTMEVVYWEHCGAMADPDYLDGFFAKQELYALNGIVDGKNYFRTFESKTHPFTVVDLNATVNAICELCQKKSGNDFLLPTTH